MCNACGFHCCGADCMSGCGCDHCDEPACWSDDEDDDYDSDDVEDFEELHGGAAVARVAHNHEVACSTHARATHAPHDAALLAELRARELPARASEIIANIRDAIRSGNVGLALNGLDALEAGGRRREDVERAWEELKAGRHPFLTLAATGSS